MEQKPATDPMPAVEAEYFAFPTTLGQQRFWSLDRLQPGNPALNMPLAARLQGRLDRAAFEKSLNEIMRRHEILRSSFQEENDTLVQIVGPVLPVEIHWSESLDVSAETVPAKTHELMLAEAQRSFDLSKGPLLRAGVVSFSKTEHLLLLSMHHIGSDGWSNGVLIRELAEYYTHFIAGEPSPADLPLQYADYAIWQKDWLAGPGGQAQRDYWRNHLGTTIPVLNLPTDRPRGPKPTFTGNIHTLLLPQTLTEQLRQCAQHEGATPYMLVLAGYVMLLHRYSNRREFVVGSPAACRNQTELEGLIGLFANPVLFRPRIDPAMTFRELLHHIREVTLGSFANQEYPFELIGEELRVEDERHGVPWLQAYFVFQKAFMQPQQMPELELTPLRSVSSGAMFEWMLGVIERKEGMRLQLEYCTDLFDLNTIDRALHHLEAIFKQVAQNMDFRIGQLVLDHVDIPAPTPTPHESTPSLIDTIAVSFENEGQSILVEDGNRRLSLAEVRSTSNQLVSILGSPTGRPPVRICIPLENTIDAITAVLAVLDAGHSAVCLPAPPPGSANPAPIVDMVWSLHSGQIQLRREKSPSRSTEPFDTAGKTVSANRTATLITAFSEDCGKGLHQFQASRFYAHARSIATALDLRKGERIFSTGGLDNLLGWEEILAALLTGCTVVRGALPHRPFKREDALDTSVWLLPAAAWQEWVRTARSLGSAQFSGVRLIALDRDPLSPKAREKVRLSGAPARLVQRHQLLELGVTIAILPPENEEAASGKASPRAVSTAVGECLVDVVDSRNVPTPHGVPGRLRLRAPWLDLSANAKAIDNTSPPEIVSDDWVRQGEQGQLEWLGHDEDLQRTSGFTLELAQLRQVACNHPAVWDAVAVTKMDGDKAVVIVHIVPVQGLELTAEAMTQYLRQHLPAYMVPAFVVMHDHAPLDRAGRQDLQSLRQTTKTRRLSAPDATGQTAVATASSARPAGTGHALTPTEQKLSKIFETVLRIHTVDVERSFFDQGGHSLLAVRLFASIEKQFGKRLPLATLLARPSVRLLAARLDENSGAPSRWQCLVPMETQGDGPKFFCVHGAGGNVLLYRDLARHMSPHARFYGLQAQGLDNESPCLTRIEDMAALYLKEILQEQPVGPYYIGGYCLGGNIAFEIGRLLVERGHEVGQIVMLDTYNLTKSLYTHTPWARLGSWKEKAGFHLHTLSRLSSAERKDYFAEKLRMAGELLRGKASGILRSVLNRSSGTKQMRSAVAFVQDANHIALHAHVPRWNPAPLTLFRPRVNYSFFPDPYQGWREVVGGKLEVVPLSANPHAMLIQPFVKEVAAALLQRMQISELVTAR